MRSPEMRYAGQRSQVGSCKRGTASSVWLELRLGGGGRWQEPEHRELGLQPQNYCKILSRGTICSDLRFR